MGSLRFVVCRVEGLQSLEFRVSGRMTWSCMGTCLCICQGLGFRVGAKLP